MKTKNTQIITIIKIISERGHIKNIYHALVQESIVNFINSNPYICRFVPIYFIISSFMPLPICKLNKLTFTSKNCLYTFRPLLT